MVVRGLQHHVERGAGAPERGRRRRRRRRHGSRVLAGRERAVVRPVRAAEQDVAGAGGGAVLRSGGWGGCGRSVGAADGVVERRGDVWCVVLVGIKRVCVRMGAFIPALLSR